MNINKFLAFFHVLMTVGIMILLLDCAFSNYECPDGWSNIKCNGNLKCCSQPSCNNTNCFDIPQTRCYWYNYFIYSYSIFVSMALFCSWYMLLKYVEEIKEKIIAIGQN